MGDVKFWKRLRMRRWCFWAKAGMGAGGGGKRGGFGLYDDGGRMRRAMVMNILINLLLSVAVVVDGMYIQPRSYR